MGISLTKGKDTILLTIVKELDREDVLQLHSDLGKWLDETAERPKFKGIDEDAVKEAFQQSQSKKRLEEELRRCFVDLLDSEYVKKHLDVYQLNPQTKEVEIKVKKLQDGKKGI